MTENLKGQSPLFFKCVWKKKIQAQFELIWTFLFFKKQLLKWEDVFFLYFRSKKYGKYLFLFIKFSSIYKSLIKWYWVELLMRIICIRNKKIKSIFDVIVHCCIIWTPSNAASICFSSSVKSGSNSNKTLKKKRKKYVKKNYVTNEF